MDDHLSIKSVSLLKHLTYELVLLIEFLLGLIYKAFKLWKIGLALGLQSKIEILQEAFEVLKLTEVAVVRYLSLLIQA